MFVLVYNVSGYLLALTKMGIVVGKCYYIDRQRS